MHSEVQLNLTQDSTKLLGLEILRFVSSFAVLVWHYQHFFFISDQPVNFIRENQPLYTIFSVFYDYGYFGVQVFWCVSGFIFFWKYRDLIANKIVNYKSFFVLRFSRLYPLHILTLILVIILQSFYFLINDSFFVYQHNDLEHFFYQVFFAGHWGLQDGFSFNGPVWSISVEVLVYFAFYCMLSYLTKSWLVNFFVVVIYFISIHYEVYNSILECLVYFYVGGLASIAFKYFNKKNHQKYFASVLFFLLTVMSSLLFFTDVFDIKKHYKFFWIFYIPFLLLVFANNFKAPPLAKKIIEAAGNMTYSAYLMHFPIQLLIVLCFSSMKMQIPYYSPIFFASFVIATFVAAFYSYSLFENPFQKFIRVKFFGLLPQEGSSRFYS